MKRDRISSLFHLFGRLKREPKPRLLRVQELPFLQDCPARAWGARTWVAIAIARRLRDGRDVAERVDTTALASAFSLGTASRPSSETCVLVK